MKIGLDFDNTIISYDEVFHAAALEWGYAVESMVPSKTVVRDYLRSLGDEERWIELQGYVYGKKMLEAAPFPGVLDFFKKAKSLGADLCIISHKTKHPFRGPKYDLHDATRHWLGALGLVDSDEFGIGEDSVFLELTKELKVDRIRSVDCSVFLDDLPEFLNQKTFPRSVRGVLFDPLELHSIVWGGDRVVSWCEFSEMTFENG